jgi:hypothetical protein
MNEPIKGYRTLAQVEIDLINEGKELANLVGAYVEKVMDDNEIITGGPDRRWVAIGRTDLQTGFMAVIRGIAQPDSF